MSNTTELMNIARDNAQRLEADLAMNVGSLYVQGGSEKMVEGEFVCSVREWQPVVNYQVIDEVGKLSVVQPEQKRFGWKTRLINDWNLRFNNQIPLDLMVEANAGTADLNLSSLTMRQIDMEMNAGSVNFALQGSQPQLTYADVQVNAGNANLRINGNFPRLQFFDVEVNASKAVIDLTGEWQHNQDFMIEANAGWLTIKLPRQIGVQVKLETSLTMTRHEGFKRRDQYFVNEALGVSPITLRLDVVASVGKVDLQIVEKIAVV